MSKGWVRPPLVDAPLYAIVDLRDDRGTFIQFGWLNISPRTGKYSKGTGVPPLSPEEERLYEAQFQRLLQFDPSAHRARNLFERTEFPLDPALMQKTRRVFGKKTRHPPHWSPLLGMIAHDSDYRYTVVSREWKTAVEALEQDPPEFFPFAIEFATQSESETYECFVLRTRVVITDHTPKRFYLGAYMNDDGTYTNPAITDSNGPVHLTFSKAAVVGRHWFNAGSRHPAEVRGPFVSPELVSKLLPLLPDRVHFFPVSVA